MLRLPKFDYESPDTVAEVVRLLSASDDAMLIAGGTDLLPNMKHELFTPKTLVSLQNVSEMTGIAEHEGGLRIGAMTPLAEVAASELVRERAPALAQAASLVAGPQLRTMGTLGGNVMLDTRCQWYNQTYFWRKSLGFCLKKDGTECHVVKGGGKCVAAASNDTAPALMTLGAELEIASSSGTRRTAIDEFWKADGIFNKKIEASEVLTHVVVPKTNDGHKGAYGKLRDRGSIDFPLLGVAVRLDVDDAGTITEADLVVTALAARPLRAKKAIAALVGASTKGDAWEQAKADCAALAYKQCHPMPNIPGDHDYRREMVPVYVRRTLDAAVAGNGPVHHL